ncbi:hypothetical protein YC2023_050430 [Brassica napus]
MDYRRILLYYHLFDYLNMWEPDVVKVGVFTGIENHGETLVANVSSVDVRVETMRKKRSVLKKRDTCCSMVKLLNDCGKAGVRQTFFYIYRLKQIQTLF